MNVFYETDNAPDLAVVRREIRYNTRIKRFTVYEFCHHADGKPGATRVMRASWAERAELPDDLASQAEAAAIYLDQNPATSSRKGVDWPLKGAQDVA